MRYVALLRGINVGGRNIIRMADLKACFETRYANVVTYIQSGNVLFEWRGSRLSRLERDIESMLSDAFDYDARVVARSADQVRRVLEQMPDAWRDPDGLRCNVGFLASGTSPDEVLADAKPRDGVDEIGVGPGVVYMSTVLSAVAKSGFSKLVATPVYQHLTIRNLNTTTKLAQLLTE